MSEDEAFARALQASLSLHGGNGGDGGDGGASTVQNPISSSRLPTSQNAQEDDDLALAQALAASEREFQAQSAKKTCVMSWKKFCREKFLS